MSIDPTAPSAGGDSTPTSFNPSSPGGLPGVPSKGPSAPIAPSGGSGANSSANSPFAKMFERAGVPLTGEQMKQMIDGLLKMQISDIKKQESTWKESMQKMKEAWEDDGG